MRSGESSIEQRRRETVEKDGWVTRERESEREREREIQSGGGKLTRNRSGERQKRKTDG